MSTTNTVFGADTSPVAPVRLREAFAAVVKPEEFSKKIRWWLNSLHAAERWFQFELAYALGETYGDRFITACEYDDYTDIAVYKNLPEIFPLWEASHKPVAKFELKWIGNWWIKREQADGILGDVEKVNGYHQPSVALVFCTVFSTTRGNESYAGVVDQIYQCETETFADVRKQLKKFKVDLRLIASEKFELLPGESSTHLENHLLGHPNPAAAQLFQDCKSISDI